MDFLIINVIFFLISILSYIYFRTGISAYCKVSKMSKTFIRKNRKGAKNYWLYKQLHQVHGLGGFYYINYLFLIALVIFAVLFILFPIKWMRVPITIAAIVLGLIEILAIFKALLYINRENFGRSFIVFDVIKINNGRRFATMLDWLFCIFPLGIYLLLTIKLFFH